MSQRRFVRKLRNPQTSTPVLSVSDDKQNDSTVSTPPIAQASVEEPIQKPTAQQPATEQPPTEQPPTEQPPTDKPTTDQPTTDQPAVDTPAVKPPAVSGQNVQDSGIIKPIDLTKQADYESIHLTTSQNGRNSYIVQLKSDASQADREAHILKVKDLCEKSNPPLAGIEAVLETVMVGYIGVFDDAVLREIWKNKVSTH